MNQFLRLLGDSVIFQGVLVVLMAGTACYLWVTRGAVPADLFNVLALIVGYFFGAKSTQAVQSTIRDLSTFVREG